VAHKEIDLKNPESNRRSAGFTDEERAKFTELLNAGFIDTFRFFYPDKTGAYTCGHTCLMPVPGMQGGELIILCVGGTKRPSCKCLHT